MQGVTVIIICLRLFIVYFVAIICLKIMGKRQIGELEISELVTAIFISELSTSPITDIETPLAYGIVPTLLLLCFEIILSFLSVKSNFFKRILAKNPTFLIYRGKVEQSELEKVRITINELMTELRLKDISDPSTVEYAVLEPNGKISVSLKTQFQPATPQDLNLNPRQNGIHHLIISDGDINQNALKAACKDQAWLQGVLDKHKAKPKDIFMLSVDDLSNIYIIRKENK